MWYNLYGGITKQLAHTFCWDICKLCSSLALLRTCLLNALFLFFAILGYTLNAYKTYHFITIVTYVNGLSNTNIAPFCFRMKIFASFWEKSRSWYLHNQCHSVCYMTATSSTMAPAQTEWKHHPARDCPSFRHTKTWVCLVWVYILNQHKWDHFCSINNDDILLIW